MKRLLLPALALALAVPAAAQEHERRGFWFGAGLGYGSAKVDCDECAGDPAFDEREGSLTGFLKAGGTLNERLLLGAEVNVWRDSDQNDTGIELTVGDLVGAAYFYPAADAGLFLKAGVGLSMAHLQGFGEDADATSWGAIVGAGYDFRVGDNVSITPVANFWFGKPGDMEADDGFPLLFGFEHNVFEVGVGITFH